MYLALDKPNERDDRQLAEHIVSLFLGEEYQRRETFIVLLSYSSLISDCVEQGDVCEICQACT